MCCVFAAFCRRLDCALARRPTVSPVSGCASPRGAWLPSYRLLSAGRALDAAAKRGLWSVHHGGSVQGVQYRISIDPFQLVGMKFRAGSSKLDQANPGLTEFFLSTFWPTNREVARTDQPRGPSRLKACRGRRILSGSDSL